MSRVASTPLDDFLNDSSSATDTGELLQRIGLFGSLFGVALAAGLVVFLAKVHRGRHREIRVLLRLVAVGGAAMLVGAAIEVAGVAAIGDLGWADALTDPTGSAPMMRLLGGLLIVLGLFDQTVPIGENGRDSSDPGGADDDTIVRWIPVSASAFGFVGVALGVMSFWFDGHTVSRGPRAIHAAVNLAHVSAGSVWFGGIVGLVVVGVLRRSTRESTAPDIVRFSSIATVALIVVTLAGALMTLFVIDGFGDLTGTDWVGSCSSRSPRLRSPRRSVATTTSSLCRHSSGQMTPARWPPVRGPRSPSRPRSSSSCSPSPCSSRPRRRTDVSTN